MFRSQGTDGIATTCWDESDVYRDLPDGFPRRFIRFWHSNLWQKAQPISNIKKLYQLWLHIARHHDSEEYG